MTDSVIKEREFRFDGVFTPVSEDLTVPIVFAEAQMQTDENFYRRYFAEIFLYLEQYEVIRPWRGLLILPSLGLNLGAELPYQEVLNQRVTRLYLNNLRGQEALSPNFLIEAILANKFPDLTKEMIMQILDLKKMDITQSRFYQEIRTEGRQEEASSLVLRLLKRRLGELSSSQEERVKGLSVEQLEALGEALLDFTDIANLENFLTSFK